MNLTHLRATLLAALTVGASACISAKDDADDSGDSSTDSGDSSTPMFCDGGTSLLDAFGNPSGFEECPDGTIHRVEVLPTSSTNPAARCAGTEVWMDCSADSDCNTAANGACITGVMIDGPDDYCTCVYSCETDADCGVGEFCAPAGLGDRAKSWSSCEQASCSSDADCATNECGLSVWDNGCGDQVHLSCRSDADSCRLDTECGPYETCDVDLGTWDCQAQNCAIGRPLLCEGEARTAPLAQVQGWTSPLALMLPADAARRQDLARRWAQIAAMEHASIASFARFTLELLSLGAPPELLAQSQQAAADEVRHAQLAYGLASAFAQQPLGPGPLSLSGVVPASDLRAFALSLIAEACVGESIGAAEALAAAEAVPEPTLRAALRAVAEDEARHAALAWRALGWALRGADAGLKAELRDRAEAAIAGLLGASEQVHEPEYGLLGGKETQALRERAARQVVRPLLDAALGA